MHGHYSDLSLGDIKKTINNNFIQLEAKWLNDVNNFSRDSNKFGTIFCVISLNTYTNKTKTSRFYIEITYFFQLSFFSNLKAVSQSIHNRINLLGIFHVNKTPLRRKRHLRTLKWNKSRSSIGEGNMNVWKEVTFFTWNTVYY